MSNRTRQRIAQLVGGASICVIVSVAFGQEFKRVPPERAAGGITIEEHLAQQQQLHNWALGEMPAGLLGASIRVDLTQQDRDNLAAPWESGTPLRIGVVKSVVGVSVNGVKPGMRNGVFEETQDGGFAWAMTVTSPGAQAIRLHFRNFSLPDGAELFVLNQDGQIDGPYTGAGRNGDGDFWTRAVSSGTSTILVRFTGPATAQDRGGIRFVLSDVGHIRGRPPAPAQQSHDSWPCADNAPCLVDANCVNGTPADPAKDAVAKMEWIQGIFVFTCTGGLIADTDPNTQRNLFLTANHCISKNSNASNMETFFFYTTDACNGNCPHNILTGGAPAPSTIGATILKTSKNGDFTLMELSQDPPAGTVFLGFNNSPIAFTGGADLNRISNPNFGPQAFSHHQVDTGAPTCMTLPRGEFIYSNDVEGATQGGSSGSPVVNSASEIVGQLFGCCGFNCGDVCDAASNSTIDGALAFYFDQVAEFLDPPGAPGCAIDADCDDGLFCNGAETCVGGSCQAGTDPCPDQGCDEATDVCITCGGNKATCATGADCCSGNCKNGTCRGN